MLSFFLFLKWLLFLDLLIFIIQFSFISVPTLVLPKPGGEGGNSSCPATVSNSTKNTGNHIVDFMTGQVSSSSAFGIGGFLGFINYLLLQYLSSIFWYTGFLCGNTG